MKHEDHKKKMDAVKRRVKMMGEMMMNMADMEEMDEKVEKKVMKGESHKQGKM